MRWSPIVELRQYTLHPGKRDELIDLFEAEFVETQESAGMRVIGTFRDLDDPDRFVWLRGFPTMESRADSLAAFYGGPVWHRHRDAANATMIDSDDVLLLRPATACAGCAPASERPAGSAESTQTGDRRGARARAAGAGDHGGCRSAHRRGRHPGHGRGRLAARLLRHACSRHGAPS
jgi:hypothetical protein